jgi:hypothetical protein
MSVGLAEMVVSLIKMIVSKICSEDVKSIELDQNCVQLRC